MYIYICVYIYMYIYVYIYMHLDGYKTIDIPFEKRSFNHHLIASKNTSK